MDARTYIYYNVRGKADSVKKDQSVLFFVESAYKKPRLRGINLGFCRFIEVVRLTQTDLPRYPR